jgi:glycosyltransferase involved in cell wall biosynthesis
LSADNEQVNPRVSVVMPAFQADWCVGAAVESVLSQTYSSFELVVVDDGSTDRTADIVAAHRGPIRLIQQDNAGVAAARNRGIAEANGELIAFCDADDMLFPHYLEALVAVYDRHGGLVTGNALYLLPGGIHPAKRRYKGRFPRGDAQRRAILEQNFLSIMTIFPRKLVDEIGPFDEARRRAEDWDFWLRAIFAGHRVELQPKPLALIRWGDRGLSSGWLQMDEDVGEVLRRAETLSLSEDERAYVQMRLSGPGPRQLGRDADDALRQGRYVEAARRYRQAAGLCPSERRLVWKARVLSAAPQLIGPLVRRRQLRIESQLALDSRAHMR